MNTLSKLSLTLYNVILKFTGIRLFPMIFWYAIDMLAIIPDSL